MFRSCTEVTDRTHMDWPLSVWRSVHMDVSDSRVLALTSDGQFVGGWGDVEEYNKTVGHKNCWTSSCIYIVKCSTFLSI